MDFWWDFTDLPAVPENVQIRQQRSNLVLLTWRIGRTIAGNASFNDNGENVRYLVEERHLVGPRYLESRLSSWTVCHVSTKPHASLRGRLKTGHWYQFRVAAVNGNGSRGYSQPSRSFKTKGKCIRVLDIKASLYVRITRIFIMERDSFPYPFFFDPAKRQRTLRFIFCRLFIYWLEVHGINPEWKVS